MKKALMMLGLAAAMTDFTNYHPDLREHGHYGLRPRVKVPLTNKQRKARAAAKRAKQARKHNR